MDEPSSLQSRTRFAELLVDETREALLALTEGGRIRSWNRRAAELLGVTADEAESRTLEEPIALTSRTIEARGGRVEVRSAKGYGSTFCAVLPRNGEGIGANTLRAATFLVVLDLLMPGVDGFAFLARFSALRGDHRTPVVVWTAKDLTPAEEERLRPSATAVITKGNAAPSTLLEQLRPLVARAPDHGETSHEA